EVLKGIGDKWLLSANLNSLGLLLANKGDIERGMYCLRASLRLEIDIGADRPLLDCRESCAEVSSLRGQLARSVKLLAAVDARRRSAGFATSIKNESEFNELLRDARRHLTQQQYYKAWLEGQSITIEDIVEYALEDDTDSVTSGAGALSAELLLV